MYSCPKTGGSVPLEEGGNHVQINMRPTLPDLAERLRLSDRDLDALQTQGTISAELRPNGPVHKLRFRVGGRQQVRYLGPDSPWVATVREALAAWQIPVRFGRELARRVRDGRRRLRRVRSAQTPLLRLAGLHFHGTTLRRIRQLKH